MADHMPTKWSKLSEFITLGLSRFRFATPESGIAHAAQFLITHLKRLCHVPGSRRQTRSNRNINDQFKSNIHATTYVWPLKIGFYGGSARTQKPKEKDNDWNSITRTHEVSLNAVVNLSSYWNSVTNGHFNAKPNGLTMNIFARFVNDLKFVLFVFEDWWIKGAVWEGLLKWE